MHVCVFLSLQVDTWIKLYKDVLYFNFSISKLLTTTIIANIHMVNTANILYNWICSLQVQLNIMHMVEDQVIQSTLYIFKESGLGLCLVTTSTSTEGMYTSGPLTILRSQRWQLTITNTINSILIHTIKIYPKLSKKFNIKQWNRHYIIMSYIILLTVCKYISNIQLPVC